MNIFRVHDNPMIAAQSLCNKHVVKMVLETAQILSAAHHTANSQYADKVYKVTHKNHPCTKWVRESRSNYQWTFIHLLGLLNEYTYRYNKRHKTSRLLPYLCITPNLPDVGETKPPQAMYDDCRHPDVIHAYRTYYKERQTEIDMQWTKRKRPNWLKTT